MDGVHKPRQRSNRAPRDQDARDPDTRADLVKDEVAGNLEQEVAPKENSCRKSELLASNGELAITMHIPINISVSDLGFAKSSTRSEIYTRASELGLYLVPAEAGLPLRLQHRDYGYEDDLLIAMEPVLSAKTLSCVWKDYFASTLARSAIRRNPLRLASSARSRN
jgi:hypothetical protein